MISEPELEGGEWPDDPAGRPGRAAVPGLPGRRGSSSPHGPCDPQGPGPHGSHGPHEPHGPHGPYDLYDTDADGSEPVVVADGRPQPVSRSGALTWGLWGALAASVLWGVGLTLPHELGPDLGGYGSEHQLCLEAPLPALTRLLGPTGSPESTYDETTAVDSAVCRTDLGPVPRDSPLRRPAVPDHHLGIRGLVNLTYVLHQSTDPAPEFDALPQPKSPGSALRTLRVPDLGERAYLVLDTVGDEPPTLRVLDGRAEFTMTVRVYTSYDGRRLGPSNVRGHYLAADFVTHTLGPAMVDDLRGTVQTLRSGH